MKKSSKIILSSVLVLSFVLSGCGMNSALEDLDSSGSSTEPGEKILTVSYTTEDEGETRDDTFPTSWGLYKLSDIDYEVVNVTAAPAVTVDMVKVAYSPIVLDTEEYTPDDTVEEDDVKYTLSDMEVDSEESVYVQEVSTSTDYAYRVTSSSVPQTKTTTVINERTGATQEVTCALSSVEQLGENVSTSYIDIVFTEYDAERFVWGNYTIYKDEQSPGLDGAALLESVGLGPSSASVSNIYWVGDAYTGDDGIVYRNARADVVTLGSSYRANYTGTITTTGTVYKLTYTGQKSTEEGTPVYEILATATYERNVPAIAAVSSAVVVVAVLIVVLLVLLSRKRKKQDQMNIQQIEQHIEKER